MDWPKRITYEFTLNTPENLIKEVEDMSEIELEVLTNLNVDARIEYLETLVKGWKSFATGCLDHRKVLYFMLNDPCKQALHDYEHNFIYAKMTDVLRGKSVRTLSVYQEEYPNYHKPPGQPLKVTMVNEVDAHESESSNHEDEENEYEETTHETVSDSEEDTDNKNVDKVEQKKASKNQVTSTKTSDNSTTLSKTPENKKKSVKSQNDKKTSLANLETAEVPVSEVPVVPQKTELSKGQKKRAKKAQKKARILSRKEEASLQEENKRIKDARIASEALLMLDSEMKTDATPTPPVQKMPTFEDTIDRLKLPVPTKDLSRFMEIVHSGGSDFVEGSDDSRILNQVEKHQNELMSNIYKNLSVETENNQRILQHIRDMNEGEEKISFEKSKEVALKFMAEKLEQWKNVSGNSSASHYVAMYECLLNECPPPRVLYLIADSLPFQDIPGFDVEKTLLLQYQSGKIYKS